MGSLRGHLHESGQPLAANPPSARDGGVSFSVQCLCPILGALSPVCGVAFFLGSWFERRVWGRVCPPRKSGAGRLAETRRRYVKPRSLDRPHTGPEISAVFVLVNSKFCHHRGAGLCRSPNKREKESWKVKIKKKVLQNISFFFINVAAFTRRFNSKIT